MVESGKVFKRDKPIKWKCSICGYTVEGTVPPPKCPGCKNPRLNRLINSKEKVRVFQLLTQINGKQRYKNEFRQALEAI